MLLVRPNITCSRYKVRLFSCREDGLNSNSSLAGIGSDWFEGALVRPDQVLSDMARALNSSAVPKVR